MAADRSTRDEDDLKSSLERTRKSKLSALQHNTHHHRPPVSSGTPARGPRRLREDNKPYGRVNRKRSPRHAPRVHPSSSAHTPSQYVSPPSHTRSVVSPVHSYRSSLSSAPSPHSFTPSSASDQSDRNRTPRRPDTRRSDCHTPRREPLLPTPMVAPGPSGFSTPFVAAQGFQSPVPFPFFPLS